MTDTSDSNEAGLSHEGQAVPELRFASNGKAPTIKEYVERHKPRRWIGRLSGDESRP